MAIPFYKTASGSWLVNNRIVPTGTSILEKNGDGKITVYIADSGEKIINREKISNVVDISGNAYADFDAIVAAAADFFLG